MKLKIIIISTYLFSLNCAFSQSFYSEADFKKYFVENIKTIDKIEGIWSISTKGEIYLNGKFISSDNKVDYKKVAIVKKNDLYYSFDLNGSPRDEQFVSTSAENKYIYSLNFKVDYQVFPHSAQAIFSDFNTFKAEFSLSQEILQAQLKGGYQSGIEMYSAETYTRIYPTSKDYKVENNNSKPENATATAFAISSDGYIVTNTHVIEGAKVIYIKGINGDFVNSYKADVILQDKANDLAILKINGYVNLGVLPYKIINGLSDVGESIKILGYPLRSSMGDEIKLTTGIISSQTGYEGEPSMYQISAPAQSGNSGGPLFNEEGNIIGIVSGKHLNAENVNYAIKSVYLQNLITLLDNKIIATSLSPISDKSLSEQVKLLKNFVYIIEITY